MPDRPPDPTHRGLLRDLLATIDVTIDGARPWDVRVHEERFFRRVLADGALGLGESYVEGWWDCDAVDELFVRLTRLDPAAVPIPRAAVFQLVRDRLLNPQRRSAASQAVGHHYDLGNDLFEAMLGRTMAYSCGYWPGAANLDEAQDAKFDLICRKIGLRAGQSVLDIGCGWGGFMRHAVTRYGATATGVTLSKEQATLGRELSQGMPIEIVLGDYRDLRGRFDHVVSIGMFEHVGPRNYATYFDVARRCLADDGLFLLHTIGTNGRTRGVDTWTKKYIFPGSSQPSIGEIGVAIERRFVMEDWHNFGPDYDRTLMAWHANFEAAWDGLRPKYGDPFRRMWSYFLCSAAGSFRARRNQLWQIVLSRSGVRGGYRTVR